jgi:hypothetical protein
MNSIDWAQALQDSEFATALHEAPIAFPVVEGIHLLGLSLSFGLLALVDLRLLGWLLPDVPYERVVQALRRWLIVGFGLTLVSGTLLFCAAAGELVQNKPFLIKLALMVPALGNALVFDRRFVRFVEGGAAALSATTVRRAGALSLALWALVTVLGRLIPYYPKY